MAIKIFLDAGHGAIDPNTNKYTTKIGKKFTHKFPDGKSLTFYEGVFNRIVAEYLYTMLKTAGYEVIKTYHEYLDWSLEKRVEITNSMCNRDDLFISIHGNAFNGKAHGMETFVCNNTRVSLGFQKSIHKSLKTFLPFKDRGEKQANFYVIKKTKCKAVLTENGFFDNYPEAVKMLDPNVQKTIALAHFIGIKNYLNN